MNYLMGTKAVPSARACCTLAVLSGRVLRALSLKSEVELRQLRIKEANKNADKQVSLMECRHPEQK